MSTTTLRTLLEAGVHYGHLTRYWDPRMAPYIFGSRDKVHIIDLEKTLEQLDTVRQFVRNMGKQNNTILFVGTKRGIKQVVQAGAESIAQPYVCKRWLGGMLTNYKTIRMSVKRLEELEYERDAGGHDNFTKKELLLRERQIKRLQLDFGGIKNMNGLPDALFIVDLNYESIAVAEARKIGIPVIAAVDTNINPALADYFFAGNDDSVKAIQLYIDLLVSAYQQGQDLYVQSLQDQKAQQIQESQQEVRQEPKKAAVATKTAEPSALPEAPQGTEVDADSTPSSD